MYTKGDEAIQVAFTDLSELKQNYAPFLENGGVFVFNQELTFLTTYPLSLRLPNSAQRISILAKVVFMNPNQTQNGEPLCLLAFLHENGRNLKRYIETIMMSQNSKTL